MRVGINAFFLRKPGTGIWQVTQNFIDRLVEYKKAGKLDNWEVVLYLEEDVKLNLPAGFSKKVVDTVYRRDDLIRKTLLEKVILPREAKRDGCDVFFSLYQSASRSMAMPHLMLVHDAIWKIFPEYVDNKRKEIYYRLVDGAIGNVDRIAAVSENSKRDVGKIFGIAEDDIDVAYVDCNGIYKQEITEKQAATVVGKYGIGDDDRYIFYVGGFDVRKNVEHLLRSFGQLVLELGCERAPDLVISGKYYPHLVPLVTDIEKILEELDEMKHGIKDKVRMIGFVEQEDLPALYRRAELFCYPSLYEGFGLPVLEAMNIGCPVVTCNNSSLSEVVSSEAAVIIDGKDVIKTASAFRTVLENWHLRGNMVVKAKEEAKKFSWDNFANKIISIINLMAGRVR